MHNSSRTIVPVKFELTGEYEPYFSVTQAVYGSERTMYAIFYCMHVCYLENFQRGIKWSSFDSLWCECLQLYEQEGISS